LTHLAKRWEVFPPAPEGFRASFSDLPSLLIQILYNRQLGTVDEARAFLARSFAADNPFQLGGMHQAVGRLRQAIREGEAIAVYGDYDVDGVTATALLVPVLQALGAKAQPYIPKRLEEGYGLNREALSELAARGVRVIVTVDCGVRSLDECVFARNIGLDLIVTDHHAVGPELPPAVAILDPRREGERYPYVHLAGVGLAYKLAQALLRTESQVPTAKAPLDLKPDHLLDLVALGTVADLAPLTGENRSLVWRGLQLLRETTRPGLVAMLQEAGVEPGRVDAGTIGFVLGPRLNAAGRLDDAMYSYKLLTTDSQEEAAALAQHLRESNQERQRLMAEMVELARQQVRAIGDASVYVLADARFAPGIAGLVSSRITEEFYRPSLVIALDEKQSKGSGRSIAAFHITKALDECQGLLVRHGGHALAAGFTVLNENIDALRSLMLDIAARDLEAADLVPTLKIDLELPLTQANQETMALVDDLQPYGIGNPRPTFLSRSVQVRGCRLVGSGDRTGLKLVISDGASVWDAIAFGQSTPPEQVPRYIDLVYSMQARVWNGSLRTELVVKDWRPSAI
jgi:single-stranded-DNA-specific exonuclease